MVFVVQTKEKKILEATRQFQLNLCRNNIWMVLKNDYLFHFRSISDMNTVLI